MVLETINPLSLFALRNYFADLTHAQPLIPDTLSLLVKQAGFERARGQVPERARRSDRCSRASSSRPVPSSTPARRALESNRARLNEVVFGPQDYALVARR